MTNALRNGAACRRDEVRQRDCRTPQGGRMRNDVLRGASAFILGVFKPAVAIGPLALHNTKEGLLHSSRDWATTTSAHRDAID